MAFFLDYVDPFGDSIHIDWLSFVRDVCQGDRGIMFQMPDLMRRRPRNHPADRTIPDRMHDARTRSVLAIDSGQSTIDNLAHTRHEFCLQILKSRNFHRSIVLPTLAKAIDAIRAVAC